MSNLIAKEYKCFEDIKHTKEDGTEYWFADNKYLHMGQGVANR